MKHHGVRINERARQEREIAEQRERQLDDASEDSFPASDPMPFSPMTSGAPGRGARSNATTSAPARRPRVA